MKQNWSVPASPKKQAMAKKMAPTYLKHKNKASQHNQLQIGTAPKGKGSKIT